LPIANQKMRLALGTTNIFLEGDATSKGAGSEKK